MKKFTKNNTSFDCINCHKFVDIHPTSSRDHCNQCLYGLHVDITPGDRLNSCKGILKPMGIEEKNGKQKIIYVCNICNTKVKNITAPDDNFESLLSLIKKAV